MKEYSGEELDKKPLSRDDAPPKVTCIFNSEHECPPVCPCHGIASALSEMKQVVKNLPSWVVVASFYGLTLKDCYQYPKDNL